VSGLALLQCVAAYPTPLEEINVRVVETLREEFGVPAGLSDHTLDPVTAPAAAVALGASVVEKHFTLDNSMEGPDHEFALEPDELDAMVSAIRNTERALGSKEKRVPDMETELHWFAHRRIQATHNLESGGRLAPDDIVVLRLGDRSPGLEPKHREELLDRRVARSIESGEGIVSDNV
jgi:N,N'-diacetyllegionaminate synthase